MLVAEIAALTATSLSAVIARRSSKLPYLLAAQSLTVAILEAPKLSGLELGLAAAYLGTALLNALVPPILLLKLAAITGDRSERAPAAVIMASAALVATAVLLSLLGAPRVLTYAAAALLPLIMLVYSRDPVRVAASLGMVSNTLHPLLVMGSLAYAAVSNVSITIVIYVAYFLAKEGWKTYGSVNLEGWDRWLRR